MKNLPTTKKSKIKISKFLTKLKDDSKLQEYHDRYLCSTPVGLDRKQQPLL